MIIKSPRLQIICIALVLNESTDGNDVPSGIVCELGTIHVAPFVAVKSLSASIVVISTVSQEGEGIMVEVEDVEVEDEEEEELVVRLFLRSCSILASTL